MYAPDNRRKEARDVIYRSNSSLDLIYGDHPSGNGLRREYGSHGSIDVIGGGSERLPAMVHNYNGISAPEKPGFARPTDRLADVLNADHADGPPPRSSASPKSRLKLNKLWGGAGTPLTRPPLDDSSLSVMSDANKRKHFAHFDCQSLMANLSYAAEVRGALLSRRRNTTTGASAASLLATRGFPPGDEAVTDTGDGHTNELVESCPFFRNELGGEEERCVSLCWRTARGPIGAQSGGWHRPRAAYGISMLEFPQGQTHWRNRCPFARSVAPLPIESQDLGASYYRNYFYNQSHQNWFGMDENLGPVAISIKKERVELRRGGGDAAAPASQLAWQYRLIVRTSELLTLRGSVLEDALPAVKPSNSATYNSKDVIEYVAPELQLNCLRLGLTNSGAEEQLLRLDEQGVIRNYKVGVMYCKSGQSTEEEMYNNQEAGPAFVEFLQMLGQTVRLKDFDKYKAGLDNKTDSTGLYSVFATHQGCEIMFHVSTMLPYTPNNRQQLLRKRHIGNDIVTIVFQEPGAAPFTPRNIRSQFQHVFVVVRAIDPCTENTQYNIAVSRAKEVPLFGPPIKEGAVYPKSEAFTELLLSKVINGENAAIQSPKFSTMATRTRQEYLKDLAKNYVTATTVETGQKFSIFSSLLMKSGSSSTNNNTVVTRVDNCINDVLVGGALCFHVQVQDEGAGGSLLECVMGVSADTIVFIEDTTRQVVLVIPTNSLLGWAVSGGWCRVYYHVGESVRVRGGGEALLRRLQAAGPAHAHRLHEVTLERGGAAQLGFHVQPDGLVTSVEGGGGAARAGLRRGARLLEVCRAAVGGLSHEHLVDLLKTSDPVTVRVTFASSPRCECEWWGAAASRADAQQPGRPRRAHDRPPDRPHSPPRSDSSGYGTGGSGRSGRRSPPSEVSVRRRSQDDAASPRHSRIKRASANTSSLTEELMRMMDSELGANASRPPSGVSTGGGTNGAGGGSPGAGGAVTATTNGIGSGMTNSVTSGMTSSITSGMTSSVTSGLTSSVTGGVPGNMSGSTNSIPSGGVTGGSSGSASSAPSAGPPSRRTPPLPLPDASALDWATLVHTATRAMLQICEESQYPSLENADTSLEIPGECVPEEWSESPAPAVAAVAPAPCACGLSARVAALENDAARHHRQRHQLEDEVRRLRRHNARLREESARAVWQLRHFTQWLKRTVERQ